jgi:hypothetical protein
MSKSCYEAAKFSEETTAAEAAGTAPQIMRRCFTFVGSGIDAISSAQTSPAGQDPEVSHYVQRAGMVPDLPAGCT